MGYDLHITRKEFWADDGGSEIPLEEWVALVKADPSIRPDDKNPGPNHYVFQYGQNACPLWWEDDLVLLCHKISLVLDLPQQGHCPSRAISW